MEARILRAAVILTALAVTTGAQYRTPNFIINTADPRLAKEFGDTAERQRRELAVSWLGHELPRWSSPCPITVKVGPNLGAGGATTFMFDKGEVFGWRMSIQGSRQRVLDSVLPHEITHMVFASHFRQPLPRWADEGGATSVEHVSEKNKHRQMLYQFLRTGRGIAFNRMFAMREYPPDIMPLYAQAHSVAEYLIAQGGRRKYVDFVGDGLESGDWQGALRRHYNVDGAGRLQQTWVAWVERGCPPLQQQTAPNNPEAVPATAVASADAPVAPADSFVNAPDGRPGVNALAVGQRRARPEPNLIHHRPRAGDGVASPPRQGYSSPLPGDGNAPNRLAHATDGWHPAGQRGAAAAAQPRASLPVAPPSHTASVDGQTGGGTHGNRQLVPVDMRQDPSNPTAPRQAHVTRPRPTEPSRQIILEWEAR